MERITEVYKIWLDKNFGLVEDPDITKARKRIVITMQLIGIPLGVSFVLFFFTLSEYFFYPGFIVLFYLIQVTASLWYLSITKRFSLAVWSFVFAVIMMALGIHIVQGGFYNSSGTLLYAFIAPTFASIGFNRRSGTIVLIFYFLLVIAVYVLDPFISPLGPGEIPKKIILLLVGINLCAVGFFVFSMLVLFIGEIEVALKSADDLLLNILPRSTADELKKNGSVDARKYESVTVLFSDFVSFTKLSEDVEPEKLVKSIDFYYKRFDEIIADFGLEKIKTIGDSYMCAGGVPNESNQHEIQTVSAAKEILEFTNKEYEKGGNLLQFEVRIGIHTGSVVAGIVGKNKWHYDIWGDTVNIASRLEGMSSPGKINISESTYHAVKEKFNCEFRGELNVKGKGLLKMYFIE